MVKKKVPRILSLNQLRRVVQVSKPPVERALILVLIDSMCRIGELKGLTKSDIVGDALRVTGKSGGRIVPIRPEVRALLVESPWFNLFPRHEGFNPAAPIVDEPASVSALQACVKQVLKRARLTGSKLGPHLLRHAAATLFIDNGGDVATLSRLLGHSSLRMTERYINLSVVALEKKHREFGALASIMGMEPATPEAELPQVTLPEEALSNRLYGPDDPVRLFLVYDNRPRHVYLYIRAQVGGRKIQVANLGTDLPLNIVDGYRQALARENERRRALAATLDGVTLDTTDGAA